MLGYMHAITSHPILILEPRWRPKMHHVNDCQNLGRNSEGKNPVVQILWSLGGHLAQFAHFSRLSKRQSPAARIFVSYLLDWAHALQPHACCAFSLDWAHTLQPHACCVFSLALYLPPSTMPSIARLGKSHRGRGNNGHCQVYRLARASGK